MLTKKRSGVRRLPGPRYSLTLVLARNIEAGTIITVCTQYAHCSHSSVEQEDTSAQESYIRLHGGQRGLRKVHVLRHQRHTRLLFPPNADGATLLSDSDATGTFQADQLIPGLMLPMKGDEDLKPPRTIVNAGGNKLQETGTGVSPPASSETMIVSDVRRIFKELPGRVLDAKYFHPRHNCRTRSHSSSRPETHNWQWASSRHLSSKTRETGVCVPSTKRSQPSH